MTSENNPKIVDPTGNNFGIRGSVIESHVNENGEIIIDKFELESVSVAGRYGNKGVVGSVIPGGEHIRYPSEQIIMIPSMSSILMRMDEEELFELIAKKVTGELADNIKESRFFVKRKNNTRRARRFLRRASKKCNVKITMVNWNARKSNWDYYSKGVQHGIVKDLRSKR